MAWRPGFGRACRTLRAKSQAAVQDRATRLLTDLGIDLGETAVFGLHLDTFPIPLHADTPLVPYARDGVGGMYLGKADAGFRKLLDAGWRPKQGTNPALVAPLAPTEHARPRRRFYGFGNVEPVTPILHIYLDP